MSWIALRITPASNREGVIAALFDAGSQGVQEDGASVVTHFPDDVSIDAIRKAVIGADPLVYLADVITRIVNGHPDSRPDELLPWAYPPIPSLKAVACKQRLRSP